ncbi:hypothetical protein INT44_000900 [Umbelopsis vinacea]|uniref:Fork-head domain-containing protein n=2 Tax=Umbelopsis TaxID=64561 RepID=A0A8H7QAB9_9FUNG|nr:hypothetical protein INT44_000900 [Umbelopsis vinacea]
MSNGYHSTYDSWVDRHHHHHQFDSPRFQQQQNELPPLSGGPTTSFSTGILIPDAKRFSLPTPSPTSSSDRMKPSIKIEKNNAGKPPYSYAMLIRYAIETSPQRKMTLSDIYAWILERYPWFESAGTGWKNSIRHNLSLNKSFVRVPRPINEPGKGSYWTVDRRVDEGTAASRRRRSESYSHGRSMSMDSGSTLVKNQPHQHHQRSSSAAVAAAAAAAAAAASSRYRHSYDGYYQTAPPPSGPDYANMSNFDMYTCQPPPYGYGNDQFQYNMAYMPQQQQQQNQQMTPTPSPTWPSQESGYPKMQQQDSTPPTPTGDDEIAVDDRANWLQQVAV